MKSFDDGTKDPFWYSSGCPFLEWDFSLVLFKPTCGTIIPGIIPPYWEESFSPRN
jgi:hypothetical protein